MGKKDPRVDAYIAKSADFAKPVLTHLRKLAHAACPKVEETLKWNMPHFLHDGILFGMAAFKQHCAVNFWKRTLVFAGEKTGAKNAMGQFGRITAIKELPSDKVLASYIRKAAELNETGVKRPVRPQPRRKQAVIVPPDLAAALKKNSKARTAFDTFSYSHRKEYVQWITEAKREETRRQRIATTIEWLAEGKSRNWKYASC